MLSVAEELFGNIWSKRQFLIKKCVALCVIKVNGRAFFNYMYCPKAERDRFMRGIGFEDADAQFNHLSFKIVLMIEALSFKIVLMIEKT